LAHAGEGRMAEVGLDPRPLAQSERFRPLGRSDLVELGDRDDVSPELLAARHAFELAQLLQRVEAHVRVRADAERDPMLADPRDREEAVAEIRLGQGTDADACAGARKERELALVGMRPVDDGRVRAEAAGAREELDWADAVLRQALLDL